MRRNETKRIATNAGFQCVKYEQLEQRFPATYTFVSSYGTLHSVPEFVSSFHAHPREMKSNAFRETNTANRSRIGDNSAVGLRTVMNPLSPPNRVFSQLLRESMVTMFFNQAISFHVRRWREMNRRNPLQALKVMIQNSDGMSVSSHNQQSEI